MKRLVLGLMLLAGAAHAAPAAADGPLVFGVLNQQSPALTAERWNPILQLRDGGDRDTAACSRWGPRSSRRTP